MGWVGVRACRLSGRDRDLASSGHPEDLSFEASRSRQHDEVAAVSVHPGDEMAAAEAADDRISLSVAWLRAINHRGRSFTDRRQHRDAAWPSCDAEAPLRVATDAAGPQLACQLGRSTALACTSGDRLLGHPHRRVVRETISSRRLICRGGQHTASLSST
jgi:hypothetical protein